MKLEVVEISKSFGEKKVLDRVSFSAESGSAVGILGRNGAGKTTTIRIIMGFFPADCGSVFVDGAPLDPKKIKIGYLPEERGLYPKKKIGEQMIYLARLRGMSASDAENSVRYWLDRVGLSEYYNKRLDVLSKGNQQKVQLALTLVNRPDIIILDEPFSGLDPVNALMLKNLISEYTEEDKLALFSSHQMNQVEEFCDDVAILNEGKIVLSGNLKEIKRGYPRDVLTVSLDCSSAEADRAYRDLEALLRRSELSSAVRHTEKRGDAIHVTLSHSSDREAVVKSLLDYHVQFARVAVLEPTLEEIFISATREEAAV